MKVIGIIPARFASTRFPGKPLVDILGQTMIMRVYESCKASEMLDEVIIATDDNRIFDHVKSNGANVVMTRKSHNNGTERIAEVANHIIDADLVINIQGDEPCIHPEQINELVDVMKLNGGMGIGTLAKPIENDRIFKSKHAVKVIFDKHKALSFQRVLDHEVKQTIGKHIGMYAFKRDVLLKIVKLSPTENELKHSLEQLRWMDHGYDIAVGWTSYESPSVDVPSDLDKVIDFIKQN